MRTIWMTLVACGMAIGVAPGWAHDRNHGDDRDDVRCECPAPVVNLEFSQLITFRRGAGHCKPAHVEGTMLVQDCRKGHLRYWIKTSRTE